MPRTACTSNRANTRKWKQKQNDSSSHSAKLRGTLPSAILYNVQTQNVRIDTQNTITSDPRHSCPRNVQAHSVSFTQTSPNPALLLAFICTLGLLVGRKISRAYYDCILSNLIVDLPIYSQNHSSSEAEKAIISRCSHTCSQPLATRSSELFLANYLFVYHQLDLFPCSAGLLTCSSSSCLLRKCSRGALYVSDPRVFVYPTGAVTYG